ncbi:7339_t:CDS:2 [Entrophospora sp. SA101]|nr:1431_t:CDS:2 [Entrophospora candida]CAJ0632526.1 7339_t:CDS:2 [Entrophospora sp. SA101]CAJ0841122.1 6941_t:CDS:2 [Entrophospora sp. SA101]CAJ0842835.1 8763_t:CDS:2 [Entrophospora sp. SA101]
MQNQPSRFDYMKHGAMVGGAVGICLGSQGYISTLGRYMLTSAGSFALFMGVGSFIRSEEQHKNIKWKQYLEKNQKYCARGFANLPVEVLEKNRWDRKIVGM